MTNLRILTFRGPWGVPVQIRPSTALLLLVVLALGRSTSDLYYLYYDAIFLAILIGSIFLHELGHAWACVIQGIPVRRVVLFGGGGFCEPGRALTARESEFVVAMGPIVNLALWALASLAAPYLPYRDLGWIAATVAHINLFLAIFNLMPVFPLDGGRLFQLGLLRVLPARRAMHIAAAVGLVTAMLWIPLMVVLFLGMGLFLAFLPPVREAFNTYRGAARAGVQE